VAWAFVIKNPAFLNPAINSVSCILLKWIAAARSDPVYSNASVSRTAMICLCAVFHSDVRCSCFLRLHIQTTQNSPCTCTLRNWKSEWVGFNAPLDTLQVILGTATPGNRLHWHWPGLADLNRCDLNHWFQSRFKSIDLFVKKSTDLNRTDDFTYKWKITINRMKCIVLLFYSAQYSTNSTRRRLILAYSHWFRNFNSVQRATHNAV